MRVDLNCDMGEGAGNDAEIMPFISSANIACGYHAGDEHTMRHTIALALQHGVAIGAHPSFPDRAQFGRVEMHITSSELYDVICQQLEALGNIAREEGTRLHHVKPHGALYNMAAKDAGMSEVIVKAIRDVDGRLIVVGLSNGELLAAAERAGMQGAAEVFADRSYQDDGSLTPRSQPGALLVDENAACQQVLQMIKEQSVTALSGRIIPVKADTVCIHGDNVQVVAFARKLHQLLKEHNIAIKAR